MEKKASAEKAVREIRRKTRRRFSAEEKIRIVIEGLRGAGPSPSIAGHLTGPSEAPQREVRSVGMPQHGTQRNDAIVVLHVEGTSALTVEGA